MYYKHLILVLLFAFFGKFSYSQADSNRIEDAEMKEKMGIYLLNFRFDKPDSSFAAIPGSNGYKNDKEATILCIPFPEAYDRVKKDYTKDKVKDIDSVIFRKDMEINLHSGYLVKGFLKSPDKRYEDYIMLSFIYPYNKSTVCMIGAYPISLDKDLYTKMLKSFGTLNAE